MATHDGQFLPMMGRPIYPLLIDYFSIGKINQLYDGRLSNNENTERTVALVTKTLEQTRNMVSMLEKIGILGIGPTDRKQT
jgi:hypothetical protein